MPGVQLQVVGNSNQPYTHYATTRRHAHINSTHLPNYGYIQEQNYMQENQVPMAVKYSERGVPEGAASVIQSDCTAQQQQQHQQQQQQQLLQATGPNATQVSTTNNTQTSNTSTTAQGAVFYAMNV